MGNLLQDPNRWRDAGNHTSGSVPPVFWNGVTYAGAWQDTYGSFAIAIDNYQQAAGDMVAGTVAVNAYGYEGTVQLRIYPFDFTNPNAQPAVEIEVPVGGKASFEWTPPAGTDCDMLLIAIFPPAYNGNVEIIPGAALVAVDDVAEAQAGQPVRVEVLANDTLDGAPVQLSDLVGMVALTVSPPGAGTAVVDDAGGITFTPAAGFSGVAEFGYSIESSDPVPACGRARTTGGGVYGGGVVIMDRPPAIWWEWPIQWKLTIRAPDWSWSFDGVRNQYGNFQVDRADYNIPWDSDIECVLEPYGANDPALERCIHLYNIGV